MSWKLEGSYVETCSCELMCPCNLSMDHGATYDFCRVVLAFDIREGEIDGTDISGLTVALIADTPKVMTEGNWRLGVFIDGQATDEQAEKLGQVFSGQLGGPMAGLTPLVGEMLGIERVPIEVRHDGLQHTVRIGEAIDFEIEDIVPFGLETGQPIRFNGMFHPVGSDLTMAEAKRSQISGFGIEFDGKTGLSKSDFSWGGMSATAVLGGGPERGELGKAFAAARGRLVLVAALIALAGLGWWSTVDRMAGMDTGPGTDLGALGWFLGVWVVMMGAMMFPSLAPTVALYARMTQRRGWSRPLLFSAGYLLVWGGAGLLAYGLFRLGRTAFAGDLAWDSAGRWFAGGVLALAAVYELTPLKDVCLGKCRSPLGFLLGSWRDGMLGALEMGCRNAVWCVGCCWALMAALFALGVMSLTWMALVAALIAIEKILPWRRAATWGTAAVLLALAVGIVSVPHQVPALVVPGTHGAMSAMHAMH